MRKENDMLSIGELKRICANIEREYGSDSKVCLQVLDKENHVKEAGYCLDFFISKEGTLYLTTEMKHRGRLNLAKRDCTNCKHNQRPLSPYVYDEPCDDCIGLPNEYWEPIEVKKGDRMKYRTKPVEIEAIQWTGLNITEMKKFVGESLIYEFYDREWGVEPRAVVIALDTLDGVLSVAIGDYIIKDLDGEFRPCEPYVFEKIYELID